MIWPFVSRRAFDRAIDASMAANQRALLAEARAVAVESRYDGLLERFTALRLAGAVSESPPVVPSLIHPTAEVDDLRVLIAEQCGGDLRRRAIMLRQLAQDRDAGESDDTIRAAILSGVQPEGVPV